MQDAERTTHPIRLPALVYVVAAGIFLMGTTEFMLAGLLPDVAADLGVDVTQAGLLITAFAAGMIIGPPIMALATLRLPRAPPSSARWPCSPPDTSSPQ